MASDPGIGAYGFRLGGLGADDRLLLPVPLDWPSIEVSHLVEPDVRGPERTLITEDRAEVPLKGGGVVLVERTPPQACFVLDRRLTPDELAHPYLAPVAGLHAHWLGRLAFHGGALVVDGRAWVVLGRRGSGKSSLLAAAALRGVPVLADDLLVTHDRLAFAGPRSIDLRNPAADHLKHGTWLGIVGERERWRLELGSVPAEVELGGWVFLRWGDRVTVRTVRPGDRLASLAANRTVRVPPGRLSALLKLVALPALELTRPRTWQDHDAALEAVLAAIASPP
jgi:hypothetical protein